MGFQTISHTFFLILYNKGNTTDIPQRYHNTLYPLNITWRMLTKNALRDILLVNALLEMQFIILQYRYSFKILFQYLFMSESSLRFIMKNAEVIKKRELHYELKNARCPLKGMAPLYLQYKYEL